MLKVYLVEDEIVIREGLKKIIPWNEYGFELCGEATDGEMALPVIRREKPDVIITDIKMPFMDGLTLSTLVKKELPETKIIILSGYDEFEYARKAIHIGVEQYLLKPITRNSLIEVLKDIREKYESENAQKKYYEQFRRELQEYEQHSRRDFFEAMVMGTAGLEDIYETAGRLHMDVAAESYNILLFSVNSALNELGRADSYSQVGANLQGKLDSFFQEHPDYLLFRVQMFHYAVLVKSPKEECGEKVEECVESLKAIFEEGGSLNWFIGIGSPVPRLSQLPVSFHTAERAFSFRYLTNDHILSYDSLDKGRDEDKAEQVNLDSLDVNTINPDIVKNFLNNGLLSEADTFVEDYFYAIGKEPLQSTVFRQYVTLNIRFTVMSFLQRLGRGKEDLKEENTDGVLQQISMSTEEAMDYSRNILKKAIAIRDETANSQYNHVLQDAVEFIDRSYTDDSLSLNKAARAANLSPNHFSAMFSQRMGQTFIEYLTELRMRKAKELLRCTDKRSSEIALEVGYKDSHYFSFLFKKTQGLTPSDYRSQAKEG